MKQYGMNKATEFSKKQISVIYMKAKNGELQVENFMIRKLYDLADYYGQDFNHSVENDEVFVKAILESVFANDLKTAQEKINEYTERSFNLLGLKAQKEADRTFLK